MIRDTSFSWVGVIALTLTTVACASEESGRSISPSLVSPENAVVVQTASGTFQSPTPAMLTATPDSYQFALTGGSDNGTWSVILPLRIDSLENGVLTADIKAVPPAPGIATVNQRMANATLVQGTAGRVTAELSKGNVSGRVTGATPSDLDAAFSGSIAVECWVSKSGTEVSGTMGDDKSPALVLDDQLEAPHCQPLRAWAP